MDLHHLRREYGSKEFKDLAKNPIDQFRLWFDEVVAAKVIEPNAMVLATVSEEGFPCCRNVLMKAFDERGLTFFTNLHSRKAKHLAANPHVGICFFWKELERQVLIEGSAARIDKSEAATYFAKRPRGSQLSAWASPQSQAIASRAFLEEQYKKFAEQFEGKDIPLPPSWGGFLISPHRFEFWQGRSDRLHDRFCYLLKNGSWELSRLAP